MKPLSNLLRAGLLLVLLVGGHNVLRAEDAKLGLAERRAIKAYQDSTYPGLKKAIDQAAGFEPAMDVRWETIARPGEAENYKEDAYWTNIYFKPVADALRTISADQMGKDALQKSLKKIVVTYDEATAPASNYPNGVKFDGGTLTINFRPFSNSDDTKDRTDAIRKALEEKL